MTITEILKGYLGQLEEEGREASIRSQVKPVIRLLGSIEADALRGKALEEYRSARRKERTIRGGPPEHSTINRELSYLRAALRRAQDMDLLERVPRFRQRSEASARRTDWCPVETLEKILGYLRPRHPDVADMVELYFLTGWRKREVMDLAWVEVDFAEGLIRLPPERNKGREPRLFPLEGRIREILERRLRERNGSGSGLVFPSPVTGRARDNFRHAWRSALDAAGRPALHIHGFRRTFATYQMQAGVPQAVTMRLAGWRTDSIYRRYLIVEEGPLRKAVRGHAAFLAEENGAPPPEEKP